MLQVLQVIYGYMSAIKKLVSVFWGKRNCSDPMFHYMKAYKTNLEKKGVKKPLEILPADGF